MRFGTTYHARWPKDKIVHQQPGLLGESGQVLFLVDFEEAAKRRQDVVHGAGSKASEEDDKKGNQTGIVRSGSIFARLWVVVREMEELGRVYSGFGNAGVGQEKKSEQVE